ncbi:hypothetical protein EG329_004076 [Mollisiaceae sp. DMI_Dod_QoI]|nr:hypothetical protein EG329_004076 [Helotiales sp. DMI_Dod_QoI]
MSSSLEDEDPSSQLRATLHESITRSLSSRRPLLTHLNADTTWLLSIPYPATSSSLRNRAFYHILIDPWLQGGQSDVAAFFSQQWHATPSAAQTISEVEDVIRRIEDAAKGKEKADMGVANSLEEGEGDVIVVDNDGVVEEEGNIIDVVVVSHEFTDHMHKETLLEIPNAVPVFATVKAAEIIRSWKHFDTVAEVPRFNGDWRKSSNERLPEWLGVSRVAKPGMDLLYYHSAIMIAFPKGEDGEAEAVIYTPHGITPADLAPVAEAEPRIFTLALLHGLQDISLPRAQLNKGAHNGLKAQRLLNAKYWIGTHDEVKKGGGIVSYFLNRKQITLKDAIEKEKTEHGDKLEGSVLESMRDVRFEDLGNGESLFLE